MSENDKPRPGPALSAAVEARGKEERLAAALRANLARRKAQARERAALAAAPVGDTEKPR